MNRSKSVASPSFSPSFRSKSAPRKRVQFDDMPKVFEAKPQKLFIKDIDSSRFIQAKPQTSVLKTTKYVPPPYNPKKKISKRTKLIIGLILFLVTWVAIDQYVIWKQTKQNSFSYTLKRQQSNKFTPFSEFAREQQMASPWEIWRNILIFISYLLLFSLWYKIILFLGHDATITKLFSRNMNE